MVPVAVDQSDDSTPSAQPSSGPEKTTKHVQVESTTSGSRDQDIDPAVERRVVRKLDWRVPPLVAFLCEFGCANKAANADSCDGAEYKLC
jgi:hypothetical protein